MNSVQAKGARWALAIVLALVCAVVVAIPTLATAGDEPETDKVGVVDDKPATDTDKQVNEAAEKATGADKQGMEAMNGPEGWEYHGTVYSTLEGAKAAADAEQNVGAGEGNYGDIYPVNQNGGNGGSDPGAGGPGGQGGQGGPGGQGGDDNNIREGGFISFTNTSKLVVSTDGPAVTPEYYVEFRGSRLTENKDYKFKEYGYHDGEGYHSLGATLPNEAREYTLKLSGMGSYTGELEGRFTVYANAKDLGLAQVAKCTPQQYAWTGKSIVPSITITLDGATLTQGEDFDIDKYEFLPDQGPSQEVNQAVQPGRYNVTVKAKGSTYTGTRTVSFQIVDPKNLSNAKITDASGVESPTYSWNDGKPVVPNVIVTAADGTVLKQGVHYTLVYRYAKGNDNDYNPGNQVDIPNGEYSEVTQEGAYWVQAKAVEGSGYQGKTRDNAFTFFVAKPENDIRKATVSSPDILQYTGGSLRETLRKETSVSFPGQEPLKLNEDYILGFGSEVGNQGLDVSGVPGKHKFSVVGSASQRATGKYYGVVERTYFVKTDEAPLPDTRVDATGVKMVGQTIDQLSTYKGENWVSLIVAKPTGDAVEEEAQAVQAADVAAGKEAVAVFDVKLGFDKTDENGAVSSTFLTDDLGALALTFPIDEKYNGYTATITQIHDGKALPAKTVTVMGGSATVSIDSLSEFVISVSDEKAADEKATDEKAADEKATDEKAATKGDKAADSKTTGKTTSAKTGDVVLPMVIGALVVIAIVAVVALLVSRRRSNS